MVCAAMGGSPASPPCPDGLPTHDFFSIKDAIVLETLSSEGFEMPKEFDSWSLPTNLTVPSNLNTLIENEEIGMLMLKLIEIIGSDDVKNRWSLVHSEHLKVMIISTKLFKVN